MAGHRQMGRQRWRESGQQSAEGGQAPRTSGLAPYEDQALDLLVGVAFGTWSPDLRGVKCETNCVQRVQQDDAGRSLSLRESPNSYRERGTRREQLRASREQHAVRTDSPKLETKQGKADRQTATAQPPTRQDTTPRHASVRRKPDPLPNTESAPIRPQTAPHLTSLCWKKGGQAADNREHVGM